jgi:hypothetical protein
MRVTPSSNLESTAKPSGSQKKGPLEVRPTVPMQRPARGNREQAAAKENYQAGHILRIKNDASADHRRWAATVGQAKALR